MGAFLWVHISLGWHVKAILPDDTRFFEFNKLIYAGKIFISLWKIPFSNDLVTMKYFYTSNLINKQCSLYILKLGN